MKMAKKRKIYKRLRKRWGLFSAHSLWQGPDHLLLVKNAGAQEDYKRFYYKDIQAVVIRRSDTYKYMNFVTVSLCLIFLLAALGSDAFATFFWTLVGLCGAALAVNLWQGPTCQFQIQTAVQTETLRALRRVRSAEKFLVLLTSFVDHAQGHLGSAQIAPSPASGSPAARPFRQLEPRREASASSQLVLRLLTVLVYGFLLRGLVAGLGFAVSHWLVNVVGGLLCAVMLVSGIAFLARETTATAGVRSFVWCGLLYVGSELVISYVLIFVVMFQRPEAMFSQWEMIRTLSEMSPFENPYLMGISLYIVIGSLGLGALGWRFLYHQRNVRIRKPEPIPAASAVSR